MRHVPLKALMEVYRDGDELGWELEFDRLWSIHPSQLDALATDIQRNGMKEAILLGSDGRVWDGHHRIAVAVSLGWETVPVRFSDEQYEYAWAADARAQHWYATKEEAEEFMGEPRQFRRRMAGPWEAVDA